MNLFKNIFFLIFSLSLFSNEYIERVERHIIIEDYRTALKEAREASLKYPESEGIKRVYIKALALSGFCQDALKLLKGLSHFDDELLEECCWSVLKKGVGSSQYSTRLASLLGASLTRDMRSVRILKDAMHDRNVIVRAFAVKLASSYRDWELKREVMDLLEREKIFFVRLELIKALGNMGILSKREFLKGLLRDERISSDERMSAISSLFSMCDYVKPKEIRELLKSRFPGFLMFGCSLAAHFEVLEVMDDVIALLDNPRSDVKIAAMNAIALFYVEHIDKKKIKSKLVKLFRDLTPSVSITAGWLGVRVGMREADSLLRRWIFSEYSENRRLAAAAIAQLGPFGADIAKECLEKASDRYVRLNLAIGLVGQREALSRCRDIIFNFLEGKSDKLMYERGENPLFSFIVPSEIRHVDQIPNYPEAVDQMTHLNLLSLLAVLEDSRACKAIARFLKNRRWGITGLASVYLLREGDSGYVELLRELLVDDDSRVQAALALSSFGRDEKVLPILEDAYFKADHRTKLIILEAIGNVGNRGNIKFLLKVMEEPSLCLRAVAASSLIQVMKL